MVGDEDISSKCYRDTVKAYEIKNGKMLRGQIEKGVLGGKGNGLIQRIFNDFSPNASSQFIDDLQNIIRDKNLKVDNEKLSINRLTKLIFAKPNIMQRPIVFRKKFYICRPPEKVLEILGDN